MKYAHLVLIFIIALFVFLSIRSITRTSITYDETLHTRSAWEWLDQKTSPSDPFNPPLSKYPALMLQVLGLYDSHDLFLFLPRLTTVLISICTLLLVYTFAVDLFNAPTGLFAAALLAFEPLFLAHTHLVTTDALATLVFLSCIYFHFHFTRSNTPLYRTLLYISTALLSVTKVTLIPMLGLYFILYYLNERSQFHQLINPKDFIAGLLVIWATYLFSFRPILYLTPPLPLGEFINTLLHSFSFVFNPKFNPTRGLIYFESVRGYGWFTYPLMSFLIKTSLPLLALSFIAIDKLPRKISTFLLLPPLVVFVIVTLGRYSTGARHLLPAFPFLALTAAHALGQLSSPRRSIIGFVLAFHLLTAVYIKDYLAYFNPLVDTKQGGRIIADSNLDWGQNLFALAQAYDPSEFDFFSFHVLYPPSIYGFTGRQLPHADNLDVQRLAGTKVAISRTTWYSRGYSKHPAFAHINPAYAANDTVLVFDLP